MCTVGTVAALQQLIEAHASAPSAKQHSEVGDEEDEDAVIEDITEEVEQLRLEEVEQSHSHHIAIT